MTPIRSPLDDQQLDAILRALAGGETPPEPALRALGATLLARRQDEADRRARYTEALVALANLEGFAPNDFPATIRLVTGVAARTLEVERASFWLFGENGARLNCLDLFTLSDGRHQAGPSLLRADYPAYFEAASHSRVIAAHDAETHPATHEFSASYLRPLRIVSMLDTPLHYQGAIAGVLCVESVGERREWTWDEQGFVASLGDLASLMLEASQRFEAELRVVEQRLARRKAEELNAQKTEFIQVVAHELRSPLTGVRGYVELLQDLPGLPGPAGEYAEAALNGVASLTRLLKDLSDLAALETGTFRLRCSEARLDDIVASALEVVGPQAAARRVELAPEPGASFTLTADALRVQQVLINLLTNALKFSTAGGRIRIRVLAEVEGALVEVQDEGPGIAQGDLGRLFQRFSQLPEGRSKGGLGLGLSIAKALVDAHGGRMGVRTIEGGGSTFWFTLPLAPPAGCGGA